MCNAQWLGVALQVLLVSEPDMATDTEQPDEVGMAYQQLGDVCRLADKVAAFAEFYKDQMPDDVRSAHAELTDYLSNVRPPNRAPSAH